MPSNTIYMDPLVGHKEVRFKGRLETGPSTGEEPEALTSEITDQRPEVIDRIKKIVRK